MWMPDDGRVIGQVFKALSAGLGDLLAPLLVFVTLVHTAAGLVTRLLCFSPALQPRSKALYSVLAAGFSLTIAAAFKLNILANTGYVAKGIFAQLTTWFFTAACIASGPVVYQQNKRSERE